VEKGKYVGGTSVPKKGAVFFAVETAPTKNSETIVEGLQSRMKRALNVK